MDTGWHQCYYLLLQALHGYNLTLDAKQFLKGKPCYCDTSGMDTTSPSTPSSSSKVSLVTVTRRMDTGWHQCYYLLLQALHGYNLTLDAKQFLKGKPCYCDTSGMDTTSPSTLSSSSKVSRVTVTRLVWIQPHPRRQAVPQR